MDQLRPAVFPFYAAHLHPNLARYLFFLFVVLFRLFFYCFFLCFYLYNFSTNLSYRVCVFSIIVCFVMLWCQAASVYSIFFVAHLLFFPHFCHLWPSQGFRQIFFLLLGFCYLLNFLAFLCCRFLVSQ